MYLDSLIESTTYIYSIPSSVSYVQLLTNYTRDDSLMNLYNYINVLVILSIILSLSDPLFEYIPSNTFHSLSAFRDLNDIFLRAHAATLMYGAMVAIVVALVEMRGKFGTQCDSGRSPLAFPCPPALFKCLYKFASIGR